MSDKEEVLIGEVVYDETDGMLRAVPPAANLPVPASARTDAMREYGVFWCPPWCAQDPMEHEYEQHWPSEWSVLELSGAPVRIIGRPRICWSANRASTNNAVEIKIEGPPNSDSGSYWLDLTDLAALRDFLDELEDNKNWHEGEWREAYPGAKADWEQA